MPSAVKKAPAPAKPVNPLYEKRTRTFSASRRRQQQAAGSRGELPGRLI